MNLFGRARPTSSVRNEERTDTTSSNTRLVSSAEQPELLLRRLEFKILRRLDGFLFGDYSGTFYGPSLDLAEVREYQPGDEVRRIDWNVTARMGVLHTRQYREEREVTAWLVIDASASMRFGTRRRLKSDLAGEFAGLAMRIITRHGDKAGAIIFGERRMLTVPPRTGRAQVLSMLHALGRFQQVEEPADNFRAPSKNARRTRNQKEARASAQTLKSGPETAHSRTASLSLETSSLEGALETVDRSLSKRALVFVVSDFLTSGEDPPWSRAMSRLASRHDVIAVRINDPAERELANVGGLRVRDPESGEELWLDTSDRRVRAAHTELVHKREMVIERVLRTAQVDTLKLSTDEDLLKPLLGFTMRRRRRRR